MSGNKSGESKPSPDATKKKEAAENQDDGGDSPPTSDSSPTSTAGEAEDTPIPRVLILTDTDEIERIEELGLGRGVNATVHLPWINKSSFQVRKVTAENVIGTEEGGHLQSYVDEIFSMKEIQSQMSASIPASDKVKIGIDAEMSRSHSTSQRSVGEMIKTRTISFKPDFNAFLQHKAVGSLPSTKHDGLNEEKTFEKRLSEWILESLIDEGELESFDPQTDDSPRVLANFIYQHKVTEKVLEKKCEEFVKHFNVTHYVSAINLGAAQYIVKSEKDYQQTVAMKNNFEIMQLGDVSTENRVRSHFRREKSRISYIGRFSGKDLDKTVHRRTTDEAVVGVIFKPITTLIKVTALRTSLQKAITKYIDDKEHFRAGPFIISCNNESVFLKVNTKFEVVATKTCRESSHFYICYGEDGQSAYEFSISHMPPSSLTRQDIKPISQYLYAPVNFNGRNPGPLKLRMDAKDTHTTMTLRSRRVGDFDPVDTNKWLHSKDIFYINCKQRFFGKNSYICVKNKELITCCVPTITNHDESKEHMLFRLIDAKTFADTE